MVKANVPLWAWGAGTWRLPHLPAPRPSPTKSLAELAQTFRNGWAAFLLPALWEALRTNMQPTRGSAMERSRLQLWVRQ